MKTPIGKKPAALRPARRHQYHLLSVLFLLLLIFFFSSSLAYSGGFHWLPTIQLKSEYDDNITFDNDNEISDEVFTCSPAVTFSYLTERSSLDGSLAVDILRYFDESNLDTEYQRYRVDGSYQLSEKFRGDASAGFIKDTTLESELDETGLRNYRQDRRRWNLGGGINYQMNERTSWQIHYTYGKTNYDGDENVDYDSHTVVGQLNRLLDNQRDTVTLQPYYNYYDSSISTVNNYGLQAGWNHVFNETCELTVFGGARYTHTKYRRHFYQLAFVPYPVFILDEETETDGNWGGVANILLRKSAERWSATLDYSRDLSYGSSGETLRHDRITGRFNYRISTRLRAGFTTGFSLSKSDDQYSDEDSQYYHFSPNLNYNLTENHRLGITYTYAHMYDKTLSKNSKYDRNRIWITLTFRFPHS
ncbi:MAG: hypothetical protein BZ151_10255 [Desulfobacca sp. 4484_104]|nr:MAG: hypothetical protein BZ151_10255 [Desulfobacca sp. 4484_104]